MSSNSPLERLHRPEPERTAPLRSAADYLRHALPEKPADTADTAGADENMVAHGVRLGYKVIEEQILQGRRLAQRLGRGGGHTAAGAAGPGQHGPSEQASATGSNQAGGDINLLLGRVLNLYKDVGSLCIDALDSLTRNPVLRSAFNDAVQAATAATRAPGDSSPADGGAGSRGQDDRSGTMPFVVEVDSLRRVQVTIDVREPRAPFLPKLHPLHAADPAIEPLRGIGFVTDGSTSRPVLRIAIPELQPPGIYTGAIVDGSDNSPAGTLSIKLFA